MNNESEQIHIQQKNLGYSPGGFWIRFVASIIDSILFVMLSMSIGVIVKLAMGISPFVFFPGKEEAVSSIFSIYEYVSIGLDLAIAYFWYGWFYANKGGSPGKLILGLKVLNAQTGENLSYGRAFVRETVGKLISMLTLLIGYAIAAIREDKRALHDLIFDTQVIKVN